MRCLSKSCSAHNVIGKTHVVDRREQPLGQIDLAVHALKQSGLRSHDKPPSKSARMVTLGIDGKRSCSRLEFMRGKEPFSVVECVSKLDFIHLR